jgi:uncharacterized protein YecA (UPF0149 family)
MTSEPTLLLLKSLPDWEIGKNQESSLLSEAELESHQAALREIVFEMEGFGCDLDDDESVDSLRIVALRNLARLGQREDVEELWGLLESIDYEDPDFADAVVADLNWLMPTFGEAAVAPSMEVAAKLHLAESQRMFAVSALSQLAVAGHQGDEIWTFLFELIRRGPLHRAVNGLILAELAEHQADRDPNFLLAIYDENLVDVTMCGDREHLEMKLGLREERESKSPNLGELEEQRRADYYRAKLGPIPDDASAMEVIDHFLILYQRPSAAKDAAMVHALLSGLIVSPEMPPPSAIMGIIWDTRNANGEKTPIWDGMEELQQMSSAVMAFYNEIVADFDNGTYEPPLQEVEVEIEPDEEDFEEMEGPFYSLESWAEGLDDAAEYLKKVHGLNDFTEGLDAIAQEVAMESLKYPCMDEAQANVSCFNAVDFLISARQDTQENPPPPYISPTAETFSPYDLPPAQPVTRQAEKIGRNDPCPCGSGRKYKKCCAN